MTNYSAQGLTRSRSFGVKQLFTTLFSIWFAFSNLFGQLVLAQSSGTDFESPIIEHEESLGGLIGGLETFNATVVDNDELESVKLFYRFSGQSVFNEVEMIPVAASSNYSTQVDTSAVESDGPEAIEYYIRAEDVSGNLVLKGFAFEPLERTFEMPVVEPVAPVATAEEIKPKRGINWLYVGLGVLAVGALAGAAASGGGDDGNGGGGGTDTSTVSVTIGRP